MSLGIELDDNLIERLRKNLGVEKVFEVASKQSQRQRANPVPTNGGPRSPETSFRHVSGTSSVDETSSAVKPFHKDFVHLDSKYSASILKELSNRDSRIDPQVRYALDKMIGIFRLQYARSPERFVCGMLGSKFRKNMGDSVARMVLETRYIDYREFASMVGRVYPSVTRDMLKTLFELISEEKGFGLQASYHDVVDFWSFLTLLKVAGEDARRSFANKQTALATEVEFWRKSNSKIALHGSVSEQSLGVASGMAPDQAMRASSKRVGYGNKHTRQQAEKTDGGGQSGGGPTRLSVAELMGQTDRGNPNKDKGGRNVYGSYFKGDLAPCHVATALHSPLKSEQILPKKKIQAFKRQDAFEYDADKADAFASDRVSYLLGHKSDLVINHEIAQLRRPDDVPAAVPFSHRKRSANTVAKEQRRDETSIADALGYVAPLPPPPGPSRWELLALQPMARLHQPTAFHKGEWEGSRSTGVHEVLGIHSLAAETGYNGFFNTDVPKGRSSSAHRRRQVSDGPNSALDIVFGNKKTYGTSDARYHTPASPANTSEDYMSQRLGQRLESPGRGRRMVSQGYDGMERPARSMSAPPRSRAVSPGRSMEGASVAQLLGFGGSGGAEAVSARHATARAAAITEVAGSSNGGGRAGAARSTALW